MMASKESFSPQQSSIDSRIANQLRRVAEKKDIPGRTGFAQKVLGGLAIVGTLMATPGLLNAQGPDKLPGLTPDQVDKIEQGVVDAILSGEPTDFFVTLPEADLSSCKPLPRDEKPECVFDLLTTHADATQAEARQQLDELGVDYKQFSITNALLVKGGDKPALTTMAAMPEALQILPNTRFQVDLPGPDPSALQVKAASGVEPNLEFIGAPEVWEMGYRGEGVKVVVIDTGVDPDHPALDGKLLQDGYGWYDAVEGSLIPHDPHGHGTHVAGIVAGEVVGVGEEDQAIGVAPGVGMGVCRNMDGAGFTNDDQSLECLEWALGPTKPDGTDPRPDLAPDVVSNSWGYYGGGYGVFAPALEALNEADIVVVFAAGNEGPNCKSMRSPGDYRSEIVLAVGSVDHVDEEFPGIEISPWSSRGRSSFFSGAVPMVMLPGRWIRSSIPGGGYANWSGTSMAAPHAAGVVALMLGANRSLSSEEAVKIVRQVATPLPVGGNCGGDYEIGPNNDWGMGALYAPHAVERALQGGLKITMPDHLSVNTSGSVQLLTTVVNTSDMTTTYVLTHTMKPEGWSVSYPPSVNDLEPGGNRGFFVAVEVEVQQGVLDPRELKFVALKEVDGKFVEAGQAITVITADGSLRIFMPIVVKNPAPIIPDN